MFHIIPQTDNEKKCGNLKWDRQTEKQTDRQKTDRLHDGRRGKLKSPPVKPKNYANLSFSVCKTFNSL